MKFIICLAPMALLGCGSIEKSYVNADRLTYEAIAPEYRAYVESDPGLNANGKALRMQTLDAWELRIRSAEVSDE